MSDAFVFSVVPDYGLASPHNSPFIPPSPFLPNATPSPYDHNIPLPLMQGGQIAYNPATGWQRPGHQRTPSWNPPHSAGVLSANPAVDAFLHPMGHRPRTQSFGGIGGMGIDTPVIPHPTNPFHLNPLLDPRPHNNLWFDLSMAQFSPRMAVDARGTQIALPKEHLDLPATHPPTLGLRITLDALPQYPIDISAGGRALTLRDVLETIYRQMQTQITQDDYDHAQDEQKRVIGKAYTRRCNALGSMAEAEKKKGLKRVDFLVGKVLFRGLVNEGTHCKAIFA